MNEKMRKMMGASVESLLKQAHAHQGSLSESEFEVFWNMMRDPNDGPENAAGFLFVTIKWMVETLKHEAAIRKKKRGAEEQDTKYETPSLVEGAVNSIHFIRFFVKFGDKGGRITRSLRAFVGEDAEFKITANVPYVKECIKNLQNHQQKQGGGDLDAIGLSILQASQLHSPTGFKKLADVVGYPTLDDADLATDEVSFCFLMQHLKRLAADETNRVTILDNTVNKTSSLPQQMKMHPVVAETTLLALLHMLRSFMAMGPVTDREFLKRIMPRIQQFYLWPCPYGNVAREILQILHNEIMSPGFTMRQQLLRESVCGEFKQHSKDGVVNRALWYVLDKNDADALAFSRAMGLSVRKEEEKQRRGSYTERGNTTTVAAATLAPTTQAMILLNAMFVDLRAGAPEASMLSLVSEQQLHGIYQKFEEMNGHLYKMHNPDQAAQWRAQALNAIRGELHRQASAAQQAGTTTDRVVLPKQLSPPFVPAMNAITHISAETKISFQCHYKDEVRLMCLDYPPYPCTMVADELESVLSTYASAPKPCEVRLVVGGGDKTLLAFLCSFLRIVQDNPEWLVGLVIKVGLLPWGKNHVSAFLARHDSWYRRHIFAPFRAPLFFLPWLRATGEGTSKHKADDEVTGPGLFYRKVVTSYMREANQVCNISVWKVEGWFENETISSPKATEKDKLFDAMPDNSIPFMQRLEIGGDSQPVTPELDFTFTKMDLSGTPGRTVTDETAGYSSILLSNVPRTGDACFPPNPLSPWLELHANVRDGKGRRTLLAMEPRQHVSNVVISCVEPGKTFAISCDGQPFGPYHHIKVSRCTWTNPNDKDKGEVDFALPLQTYFPVHM